MKLIQWNETDAFYNLAVEEYVLLQLDMQEEFVLLWQNKNAIVVGCHQNTIEEINQDFVREKGIQVVRRLTGGGAVYHDLGNLNFSFVLNAHDTLFNFRDLSMPIVESLEEMGVKVEFTGRNDLVLDGKKISGTAQSIKRKRLLHHGTLLFDSDLEVISRALQVSSDKIESKGIKSVRSRVTNICDKHPEVNIASFKAQFAVDLVKKHGIEEYHFTEQDIAAIEALRDAKYATWEWNFGRSPQYDIKKTRRFTGGTLDIYMCVEKGVIKTINIYGDYFGDGEISEIEESLREVPNREAEVNAVLRGFQLEAYIHDITLEELTNFIVY